MTIANSSSEKVAVFFGSPNTDGNTKRLLDCFLSFCPDSADVTLICCYDLNILPCAGCDLCRGSGNCVHAKEDDFEKICQVIASSDRFIIATPIYFLGFPGPMKTLFDRFQTFYHNHPYSGGKARRAVLLAAEGSADETGPRYLRTSLEWILKTINTELADTVILRSTDRGGTVNEEDCRRAALKLFA